MGNGPGGVTASERDRIPDIKRGAMRQYPHETNAVENATAFQQYLTTLSDEPVAWTDSRLFRVTRLRLLSEPGYPYWDVSYCHGVLVDGTNVRVQLPFDRLPKQGLRAMIVRYAAQDKVYARGLGLLDETVISKLW